jgi:hypothetical protein
MSIGSAGRHLGLVTVSIFSAGGTWKPEGLVVGVVGWMADEVVEIL